MRALPAILLLVACAGSADEDGSVSRARAFADSLRTGECGILPDAALRDACLVAATERTGTDRCAEVVGERARGECWFRLAESRRDPGLCTRAAPFADDCALHVLTRGFDDWLPRDARPGAVEADAEAHIRAAGLSPDDPRPWSALYRTVLARTRPLDRRACAAVSDPTRREACARTGLAHYSDLLNAARDRGQIPCVDGRPDESALPPLLRHAPDPELDALRAARNDLCRGGVAPPGPTAPPG